MALPYRDCGHLAIDLPVYDGRIVCRGITQRLLCGDERLWLVVLDQKENFTPSTVPFWDAWISATAWAGMWLLAKRKIENWILLNISNAFAIPILFYKHLLLYSGLTIFLFIVAVQGYITWRKITRKENIILVT